MCAVAAVHLVLLRRDVLEALVARDITTAGAAAGVTLPEAFLEDDWLWRYRLAQLDREPDAEPWLPRAVIVDPLGAVVGHAGFHGPPDERGMVEIGYTVLPDHRHRGYAKAAVAELLAFARAHGARVVRASVSPGNEPSLAVIRSFGFEHCGEQVDEEDGLELVFERPL